MRRSVHRLALLVASLALLCVATGCPEDQATPPGSLEVPRDVEIVQGPVCMESVESSAGVVRPQVRRCEDDERGAIGLVTNQESDRVSVIDFARDMQGDPQRRPRPVDLDASTPGMTGMKVGAKPVEVAAAGTVGYSVEQTDRALSVINLWVLDPLSESITFDSAPTEAVVTPETDESDAHLAVALPDPARLWVHEHLDCDFPEEASDGVVDRGAASADEGCSQVPAQEDGTSLELPGRVADVHASPEGGRLFIAYRDTNFASVVALDDEAIGDGECRDGDSAPCEVERVGLTFDCSNDVDDDGDGDIDEDDP
ncbi:MAG: hypothetical protein ACOCV2_13850, partial [Persicimonas sp.]